jgi:hypothetical protein
MFCAPIQRANPADSATFPAPAAILRRLTLASAYRYTAPTPALSLCVAIPRHRPQMFHESLTLVLPWRVTTARGGSPLDPARVCGPA